MMQQLGVVQQGRVHTAGVSAGALAMGCDYPDQGSHDRFIERGTEWNNNCRANRGCYGTLDAEYAKLMEEVLTPTVHEAISGRACMVYSRGSASRPE